MANELDNLFEQYAKKAEAEAKASKGGNFIPRIYDEIKYTGLETNQPSVLRAVGGPPDSEIDASTAKTVTIARIIGDDGKKLRVIRPSFSADPNYILNRIISRVKQAKWVNNEKTYPVKDQFPEIFNIIEKNGIKKGDPKAMYDKGWQGREVLVMNVIDRAQMDWHRQNKHTMLLAKSVNEVNGIEYVEEGISSFAAGPKLNQLFKYYGSWEKYDIAITKTGDMSNAFNITNATKNPETVEGSVSQFISMEDHLTDEEKSWERYDLTQIFRTTTSTKIYNRLKGTIARIDAALNTHFLTELEAEVEAEKKLFAELYGDKDDDSNSHTLEESISTTHSQTSASPTTVNRSRASVAPSKAPWEELPYGSTLSDDLKKKVKSVSVTSDGKYEIEWDGVPLEELASCPTCGGISPLAATSCPCCGQEF